MESWKRFSTLLFAFSIPEWLGVAWQSADASLPF